MIKVAEVLLKCDEHEAFNAGLLNQICKAYDKTEIVFFARSLYIEHMRQLLKESIYCARLKYVPIDDLLNDYKDFDSCLDYIYNYGIKDSTTLFCTNNSGLLRRLQSFMNAHKNLEVYVCGHGEIECLTSRTEKIMQPSYVFSFNLRTIAHVVKDCFLQLKSYNSRKQDRIDEEKALLSFCESERAHLFFFSETYKKLGKHKYKNTLFNHVEFIHLPYVYHSVPEKTVNNDVIRIGCTPRTLRNRDGNTWKIIKYVLRNANRCKNDFVFSFFVHYHPEWPHLETFGAGKESKAYNFWRKANDRKHLVTFLEKCDFMLISYGKDMYILSSSGIMTDSVQHETPVFMYQSHCFDDYNDWKIGKRAYTVEEMGETIISEINAYSYDVMKSYKKELIKCKEAFENHNVNLFRGLQLDTAMAN